MPTKKLAYLVLAVGASLAAACGTSDDPKPSRGSMSKPGGAVEARPPTGIPGAGSTAADAGVDAGLPSDAATK